ncbi:MAG: sigma-54-dependent transcriptional regulator [Alphaproteobacteria bacterium]
MATALRSFYLCLSESVNEVQQPHVLLVEDTPSVARVYLEYLRPEPVTVTHVETGNEALRFINKRPPEAILLDLVLPDMDGMEILRDVVGRGLPTAVVVITAHGSISNAVSAMRGGAFDFLVKPFNAERLIVTLRNALERRRLTQLVETYKEVGRDEYFGFTGSSLPMQAVYRMIESAAPSKATVFITGESGTGKEVCAEAIHRQSPRRDGAFVALNCAAIPKDLMESEIFGHVKGAFTGAVSDRAGAAAKANGGTLFLDEICEMDLGLQSKLLRFIQTGTFQRVGSTTLEKVDVRFICASNRDPLAEVEAGRFREDLYYRLHVIPISLPPLRDRDADVMAIARKFLVDFAREEKKRFVDFSPEVEAVFQAYTWPGNVRQLQNVVRNVVVLNEGETVGKNILPPPLNAVDPMVGTLSVVPGKAASALQTGAETPDSIRPLWVIERDAIERAIEICGGNIPRAAAHLGISASTIYRKRLTWEAQQPMAG